MIEKLLRSPAAWVALGASYFFGLWWMSIPLTGDQKIYLTIALEMRERGEILIPYLFSAPNFLKPPLQYWATLVGWKLFGFGLFGALAPSVLALFASAWWVKRISGSQTWIPSVFFCSTLASMTYGTTSQMEIWVVLFYLTAWGLSLNQRPGLAWAVAGVMAWIKGPLYPVLWGLGWMLEKILNRQARELIRVRTLIQILLGVALGLLWFVLASRTHFDQLVGVFMKRENLGKMNTPQGTSIGLWAEFIATLFPMLPWLVWSVFASPSGERIWNRNFLIAFGLIPAIFFTVFPYRVGTYLYPLTPVAIWLMREERFEPVGKWKVPGLLLVWVPAIILALLVLRLGAGGWLTISLSGFLLVSLAFWAIAHLRFNPAWIALASLMLVTGIRLGGGQLGERDLSTLRSQAVGATGVYYWMENEDIWHEVGLMSAAIGQRIHLLKTMNEVNQVLKMGAKVIFTDEQGAFANGLKCQDWVRLKRRMKFPLRELILSGLRVDDPALSRRYQICGLGQP